MEATFPSIFLSFALIITSSRGACVVGTISEQSVPLRRGAFVEKDWRRCAGLLHCYVEQRSNVQVLVERSRSTKAVIDRTPIGPVRLVIGIERAVGLARTTP